VIHIGLKIGIMSADPTAAASDLLRAIIEPYGVLWFIYLLAAFSFVAKLAHDVRAPRWGVLAIGAVLQILPVHTGSYLIDQFAEFFVYFCAGYVFAPWIFRLVDLATRNVVVAIAALALYAAANVSLVFSPGFAVLPDHIQMGYAAFPGVHLALAVIGSLALCVTAALISRLPLMGWLRWLGERSIVVYLAFVLPMSFARIGLGKLGLIHDVTLSSLLVMVFSIAVSIGLYLVVRSRSTCWSSGAAAASSCSNVPPGRTSPAPRAAAATSRRPFPPSDQNLRVLIPVASSTPPSAPNAAPNANSTPRAKRR
jgi:uncharacterized membrane protein YcfT